jgi:hypothetical protein
MEERRRLKGESRVERGSGVGEWGQARRGRRWSLQWTQTGWGHVDDHMSWVTAATVAAPPMGVRVNTRDGDLENLGQSGQKAKKA